MTDVHKNHRATLAFAGFAVLIACRDVVVELFLDEDPVSLAFVICATIAGIAFALLLAQGTLRPFMKKLWPTGTMSVAEVAELRATSGFDQRVFQRRWRADGEAWVERKWSMLFNVLLFGIFSGAMYAVVFFFVRRIGAGLFNFVDYGLTPVATALLGAAWFGNRITRSVVAGFAVYAIGLALLSSGQNWSGFGWLGLAALVPLATAATDGLTAWLRDPRGGNLNPSELLVARFLPAALVLFAYSIALNRDGIVIHNLAGVLATAVLFGFLPLWLLTSSLRGDVLTKLATWEFVIPALAFLGTLHAHPDHQNPMQIAGAAMIFVAMIAPTAWSFWSDWREKRTSESGGVGSIEFDTALPPAADQPDSDAEFTVFASS